MEQVHLRDIFPYSVQMRENTEQKNSEYGHFLPSGSMKSFIEYVRKMFRKIHISYPLIRKILENSAHVLNGWFLWQFYGIFVTNFCGICFSTDFS